MKITEKALLDGYKGLTNCGDLISILPIGKYGVDQTVYWSYGSYSNDGFHKLRRVMYREESDAIRCEVGILGKIVLIDTPQKCMNKVMNKKIQDDIRKDYEELLKKYGN